MTLSITQKVVRRARERGLTVIQRNQWGTVHEDIYQWRRQHKPHQLLPGKPVDTVWQHITVTVPSGDFREDCRVIERIGFERFGTGCSYNFMVDMTTGHIGVGQPLDAKGAHTVNDKHIDGYSYDQNAVAIGIAVIGMPDTHLSAAATVAIATLIAACMDVGAVTPDPDYVPHSLVAAKDCPCDSTRDAMPRILRLAQRLHPAGAHK